MTEPKFDDPLEEWNRLNIENAEQGFVSAMYQSVSETSPLVGKFSMWLLAGTGATAALLITQIKSIIPYISLQGLQLCLIMLVISSIAGFIAKFYSLRCEIQNEIQKKLIELINSVLEKHAEDEREILEYANERGLILKTNINLSNIIIEYSRPFPFWIKWLIARKTQKTAGDRQAGFHIVAKAYTAQLSWTFLQAVMFIVFIFTAMFFVNNMLQTAQILSNG